MQNFSGGLKKKKKTKNNPKNLTDLTFGVRGAGSLCMQASRWDTSLRI